MLEFDLLNVIVKIIIVKNTSNHKIIVVNMTIKNKTKLNF